MFPLLATFDRDRVRLGSKIQHRIRGLDAVRNSIGAEGERLVLFGRVGSQALKLDYPEQYQNLDCSKPEYDSPHSWNDWGD